MDWQNTLIDLSNLINNQADDNMIYYDKSTVKGNWLGYAPATDEEISNKETELGIKLPKSYVHFLKITNGFKQISLFSGNLLPVSEINWLEKKDKTFFELENSIPKDLIEISDDDYFVYDDNQRPELYKTEYLLKSIMVSEWTDGSVILLNPNVSFGDECEAWVFSNWLVGAKRYKSFSDLIIGELQSTYKLIKANESQ